MDKLEEVQAELESLKQRVSALTVAHAACEERLRELREQNAMLRQLRPTVRPPRPPDGG
jgi:predicted nuclease with TOPRIM domain